jgi:hypothetical protein
MVSDYGALSEIYFRRPVNHLINREEFAAYEVVVSGMSVAWCAGMQVTKVPALLFTAIAGGFSSLCSASKIHRPNSAATRAVQPRQGLAALAISPALQLRPRLLFLTLVMLTGACAPASERLEDYVSSQAALKAVVPLDLTSALAATA